MFTYLESGKREHSIWKIVNYDDLVFYSYIRPSISQERVMVAQDASICAFLPKLLPEELMELLLCNWNGMN